MSTREEMLALHLKRKDELLENLKKAQEDWIAFNKTINQWMQEELGLNEENSKDVHITEILSRWSTGK